MAARIVFEVVLEGERKILTSVDQIAKELEKAQSKFLTARTSGSKTAISQALEEMNALRRAQNLYNNEAKKFGAGGSIREASAQLAQIRRQYDLLSADAKKSTVGRSLAADFRAARTELLKMKGDLAGVSRSGGLSGTNARGIVGGLASTIPTGGFLGGGTLAAGLTGAGPYGAIAAAATAALAKITSLNAEVDDLLSNLIKTGNLTREQAEGVLSGILALDTRTAIQDLLEIGTALGQLGVKVNASTIDSIDKLSVALSDEFLGGAKEVATEVGKLRLLMNEFDGVEDSEAFLRIGNALNYLGATGAATAPVVSDFATRVLGAAGPLGLSAEAALGFGAALQELGTAPERAAGSVSSALFKLGEAPKAFAKAIKITDAETQAFVATNKELNGTVKTFSDLAQKDIGKALLLVAEQTSKLNLSNEDFIKLLDQLGLKGIRMREVFGKLVQDYQLFGQRVNDASGALENSNSILQEFAVKNDNLQGQLLRLGNTIKESFINSGLISWLGTVVSGFNDLLDSTARFLGAQEASVLAVNQEYDNLTRLISNVQAYNKGTKEREAAIKALNDAFPSLFEGLSTELDLNSQLTQVLRENASAYAGRAKAANAAAESDRKNAERAETAIELERARAKLLSEVTKISRETGKPFEEGDNFINSARKFITESTKGNSAFIAGRSTASKALADYNAALLENAKASKAASDSQSEFEGVVNTSLAKDSERAGFLAQKNADLLKLAQSNQAKLSAIKDKTSKEALELVKEIKEIQEFAKANASDNSILALSNINGRSVSAAASEVKRSAGEISKILEQVQGARQDADIEEPKAEEKARKKAEKADRDRQKKSDAGQRELDQAEQEAKDLADALKRFNDESIEQQNDFAADRENALAKIAENEQLSELQKIERNFEKRKEAVSKEVKDFEKEEIRLREQAAKNVAEAKEAVENAFGADQTAKAKAQLEKALADEKTATELITAKKIDIQNAADEAVVAARVQADFEQGEYLRKEREKEIKDAQEFQKELLDAELDAIEASLDQSKTRFDRIAAQRKALLALDAQEIGETNPVVLNRINQERLQITTSGKILDEAEIQKNLNRQIQTINDALTNDTRIEVEGGIKVDPAELEARKSQLKELEKEKSESLNREKELRAEANVDEQRLDEELFQARVDNLQRYYDYFAQISAAILDLQLAQIEKENEAEQKALEDKFDRRLNAVKGNAIEEERVEKDRIAAQEKLEKEYAEKRKKIAIKQALIDAAASIIAGFKNGLVLGLVNAALVGALTGIQIKKIKETTFAEGGFTGKGLATQRPDSTGHKPVGVVHANEYVVPKKVLQTREGSALVGRLEAMRKARIPVSKYSDRGFYASGGATNSASHFTVNSNATLDADQVASVMSPYIQQAVQAGITQGTRDVHRRSERERIYKQNSTI